MKKLIAAALLALLSGTAFAEDIFVIVPYVGVATNVYEKSDPSYEIDWEDTKLMEGLFFQWVNTDLFQANAFVYHSEDINYSRLIGGHVIADYYVWSNPLGRAAVGAGLEVISLDTDAGDTESAQYIFDLELPLTLYAPFARAGHYFDFGSRSEVFVSVFPWAGVEYDISRGDVELTVDPPGLGSFPVSESADDETWFGLAGISVSTVFRHFLELQVKYKATFNADDLLHTVDGMANVYFSRHWGVSYRFKYMQSTGGSTSYHIAGIAYAF